MNAEAERVVDETARQPPSITSDRAGANRREHIRRTHRSKDAMST